ncbi:ParA family protein [Azotobacter salinestris]|uniref:ParA family protein n=1 Tax=Azotobacter salinestris TaxID=69964 RepID=UPI0032DEB9CF
MPTTIFVSPKGGVGKTTSALALATQLAKKGAAVTVIDADPNYPIQKWAEGGHCPENLRVISGVTEDNISGRIREAAAIDPFVIVDLEGTAAKIVIHALQEADFVVIPMRGSWLDAQQAGRAVALVHDQEMAVRRHVPDYTLPYSVLLTCTPPAYETRNTAALRRGLKERGIPLFATEMTEREAFRSMFFFKRPLEALDSAQVPGIEKAIANAEAFAAEVIERLSGKVKTSEVAS